MKLFILEDDPSRIVRFKKMFGNDHEMTFTEHAEEALNILKEEEFDVIFLDHDLGGRQMVLSEEEDTGYQVAKRMDKTVNKETIVIVHSHNPVGATNMVNVLTNGVRRVYRLPFGMIDETLLDQDGD